MPNRLKILTITILAILISACSIQQNNQMTEQSKPELDEIINIIKSKPEWLEPSEICPSEIIPTFEKDILYLDEGCENSAKICFDNCKNNDGNACYALALLLQRKSGIDFEESNPLFLRSCKLGIISGCTNRAAFKLDLDSKDQKSAKCSADTFEKTCQMNDSWGCSMYGTILASGYGREQNIDESLNYLKKACDKFGLEDEACRGAMQVKEEIEKDRKENEKNGSSTNKKNGTGKSKKSR